MAGNNHQNDHKNLKDNEFRNENLKLGTPEQEAALLNTKPQCYRARWLKR
jgi:hypothetical protein